MLNKRLKILISGLTEQKSLLIIFLLIGLVYRFSAVYPSSPTRFAPASCALQSCWIYEGDRPIFYSGQAWMGPAGNYLIAIMYKIFGISSLTLSLFAWLMSALYYLLTVFLAFRLFGKGTALCTALLFMIPNVRLMYLAGQPRSHYELCFVLTPLVFLMTLSLLDRFRDGKTVLLYSLLLGFLSGFAFWNNMSIGPAIAVCVLVLWIRLKRQFFKPWLLLYICGGLIGFSPVIYYNLTTEMVLTGQANVNNAMNFFSVLKAFITNALPYFWEIQFRKMSNPVLVYVSIAFLVWIGILYLIVFIEGVKKAWKKEDWLGYGVLFGYLMGHLLITSVSSYGKRFAEGSNPISYIINLYTVAFTIPAVIASYKWKVWKKLILLFPFCFYLVNNSVHTFHYPKLFYSTLKEKGWSSVTRYPDPDNPLLGFFSKHDLKAGYIGRSLHAGSGSIRGMNFLFNLECFGKISFADFSSERYLPYALKADAAEKIFWLDGNPGLFQMAGVQCRLEMVGGMPVCYDFSKTEYAEELITPYRVLVSPDHFGSSYLTDNNITSFWSLDPEAVKHGSVFIEFNETESLHKIVLFPEKADNSPDEFSIRVSRNNRDWETVFQTKEGQPVFWSEAHPFIKLVKPRMEIVLPDRPGIKYCEIIFDVEKRKNALSICEMLLVKRMEKISSDRKTRERAEIIASLFENHRNKVIVGDHWWCNYFHLHGFPVDFISNQSVNNCGLPNPNLSCGVALNFSKNHVLIAEKTHARSIENKLNACHIPFQKKSYLFRDLYDIPPNHTRSLLYWNGLQLNDILPVDAGRFYYPYPLLKNIFPQAVPSSFVFGDKLKMTAFYFQTDRDKRSVTLFLELLPLVSLEKDYYLFIHYCDDKGRVLFQGDVKMEHFRKPTSLWQDNMRVLMERTVWIPVFVTGKVFIKTGIWHPDSGKQLKIERQTKKETHVILGSFDI